MNSLEKQILYLMENVKRQVKIQPLNLGGVLASGGGSGGPPGGFTGWLPQTRVAYDISELELSTPTYPAPSGVNLSLLDNLNHIRKRIGTLENYIVSGGGGTLTVQDDTVEISDSITVLNFGNNLDITLDDPNTVTIDGVDAISVYEDTVLVDDAVSSLDFTNGLTADETDTHYITLAINQNKIIRRVPLWADPPYEDTYYPATNAGFSDALADAALQYDSHIYLPPGEVYVSDPIPEYTKIIGAGSSSYGSSNCTYLSTTSTITIEDSQVAFKDLTIYRSSSVAGVVSLFTFGDNYVDVYFDNCTLYCRNSSTNAAAYSYIFYNNVKYATKVIAQNTHFQAKASSSNAPYLFYDTTATASNRFRYELVNCGIHEDSDYIIDNSAATDRHIYNMSIVISGQQKTFNYNADLGIESGDIAITIGDLNITTGNATVNNGNIEINTGDFTLNTGDATINNGNLTVASGISRFGNYGEGNYTQIDKSGHLQLFGDATVFDDLQYSLVGQRLESPASNIVQNDAESSLTFDDACTLSDYVSMNIQMSHKWKLDSTIYPHIHWWQTSSDIPNWLIQYRWQRNGYSKITVWSGIPYDGHAFSYVSGTLNQITTFSGIIPPVNAGLSDIIQVRLLRDTDNDSTLFGGTDPLTGDSDVMNLDIHIETDTLGSDEEYLK